MILAIVTLIITTSVVVMTNTAISTYCRIHHVTASMTTIDLIINIGQDDLESVTNFLNSQLRHFSSCVLSIYFSQFYLCYCLVRTRRVPV